MCSGKGLAVMVLVVVNFIFATAGLLMLAFGVAAAAKPESIIQALSYTEDLTTKATEAGFDLPGSIQSSAVFLIVMGAVVAVLGLFGCIGACCKVQWMLGVYIIVLVIILLAEIALIIFGALFPDKFKSETQPAMQKTLWQFKTDLRKNETTGMLTASGDQTSISWSSMQAELRCCGATDWTDYMNVTFTKTFSEYPDAIVPVTCCRLNNDPGSIPTKREDFEDLAKCQSPSPIGAIYEQNCYMALETVLKQYGRIGIGIAAAIIGIEVILILLAAWICRSIATTTKSQSI